MDSSKAEIGRSSAWTASFVRSQLIPQWESKRRALALQGIVPTLALYFSVEDGATQSYRKSIQKIFERLQLEVVEHDLSSASVEEWQAVLEHDAHNPHIHGMLLLYPLPEGVDERLLLPFIPLSKDVDDCRRTHARWYNCAVDAVLMFCDAYGYTLRGKTGVIFGKGRLLGQSLGEACIERGASVRWVRSSTKQVQQYTSGADFLCGCIGKAHVLPANLVEPHQVLLDCGIDLCGGRLVGDFSEQAQQKARHYTPTPGGISSLTTWVLASHLMDSANLD